MKITHERFTQMGEQIAGLLMAMKATTAIVRELRRDVDTLTLKVSALQADLDAAAIRAANDR